MRKLFLLSFLLLLLPMLAIADEVVKVDGIYYRLKFQNSWAQSAIVTSNPDKYSGKVVIPDSISYNGSNYPVIFIGENAFSGCTDLTSVVIPDRVSKIDKNAFSWCKNLTSIYIPDNVNEIGDYAFAYCEKLTSIRMPEKIMGNAVFGKDIFMHCFNLTSITIPEGVHTIIDWMFADCWNLTTVKLPSSLTYIGKYAFKGCRELSSITIPNKVTEIGEKAFFGSGLTSVSIPNSVITIDETAFWWIDELKTVTIGKGVKEIGSKAFAYCKNLTDFYCYATTPPSAVNIFESTPYQNATLHVPAASINNYKNTYPWKNFKNIVPL